VTKDQSTSVSDTHGEEGINATSVHQWLMKNPEFLKENSELFTPALTAERVSDEGVVNMQSFLVERLQKETNQLKNLQGELVSAARNNLNTQKMVHDAVTLILSSTSLSQFVHTLTQQLPEVLDVDVITLCVEDGPVTLPAISGLQRLKRGSIDRAHWNGSAILMRPVAPKSKAVFGPAKELVQSDSLIRLNVPTLYAPAMLAIGSHEEGHFHPEQATDLLAFLATCVQSCLRMWVEHSPVS
jgi:uncharacterized protein